MTITVIGTGFVGVVTAAVLARHHTVYGLDIDEAKIAKLRQGLIPFYEPGLEDLVQEGLNSKKLIFTTAYKEAVENSDVIMIAVGTPSATDGTADLKYVKAASQALAPHLKKRAIVALKSTVPPGTNDKVKRWIKKHTDQSFHLAALPEFLREGSAVKDTQSPDRVVIGATEPPVIEKLLKLHQPLSGDRLIVTPESAQMGKYTANAYLANRIVFINQIANLCEKNGADISEVVNVIGKDTRIGSHYWYPGLGYGGSCFPKDVMELASYAKSVGEGMGLLVKIDELNGQRIHQKLREFSKKSGGFKDKTVAVLGLSFKPHTNDLREAPSLTVIPYLQKHGAKRVKAYDPEAMEEADRFFRQVVFTDNPYEAIKGAEVIILLTEWPELVNLNVSKISRLAAPQAVFIDTRNQYQPQEIRSAGLTYIGIGVL